MVGILFLEEISLYFHIPFCKRKCDYCHFYVLPDKELEKDQLLKGLHQEWLLWLPELSEKTIVSIYFGGGTPSLFGADRIAAVLQWIKDSKISLAKSLEITLEANPEQVNLQLMQDYAKAGINRVSIGVQTLDDALLNTLTREHSAKKAIEAIYTTAEANISNISIDLMYDLPGQNLETWKNTLSQAILLPIFHLSLYNLTIEPHTPFFKKRELLQKLIPNENVSLSMYEMATQMFNENGLQQYEISAFARNGQYSRHNVGYWTARPFLGFGPSAFSYWKGSRFRSIANLNKYCSLLQTNKFPIDFKEELDPEAKIRELFVIQIRLISGVHVNQFEQTHGSLSNQTKEIINNLKMQGFVKQSPTHISLTTRGILFYDTVASELI